MGVVDEDQQKIFNQSTKIKKRDITKETFNEIKSTESTESLNTQFTNAGNNVNKVIFSYSYLKQLFHLFYF